MGVPRDKNWPFEQRCYVANRLANWAFLPDKFQTPLGSMYEALRAIELVTVEAAEFCEASRARFEEMVDAVESRGGSFATPAQKGD